LQLRELSLDTGEVLPLAGSPDGAAGAVPLRLEPYEARLIELKLGQADGVQAAAGDSCENWQWDAAGPWELKALNPNALRLDAFRLEVYGKASRSPELAAAGTVIAKTFIDQCADLAEAEGLPVKMQQTFGTPMKVQLAYPLTAVYTAEFDVAELPKSAALLMDRSAISGAAVIRLNGRIVQSADFRPTFLYDHNNVSADVTDYLNPGATNTLTVEVDVEHDWDGVVDALYIVGPFLIRFDGHGRPVLSRPPAAGQHIASLEAGPYPGYPYYAGDFSLTRTLRLAEAPRAAAFDLTFRDLDPDFHDCAEILVNGHSLGVRTWSPYRWHGDASYVKQGDNQVEVRVTNTLIGMLEGKYFDNRAHAVRQVEDKKELHLDGE
jgi:hypothetical protein